MFVQNREIVSCFITYKFFRNGHQRMPLWMRQACRIAPDVKK